MVSGRERSTAAALQSNNRILICDLKVPEEIPTPALATALTWPNLKPAAAAGSAVFSTHSISKALAEPSFQLQFNGARAPGPDEIEANPRARSAKLRAAIRTAAPVWKEAA